MITPKAEQALRFEREVYVTTYTAEGKPGTVPVWFVTDGQRVYISTEPTSKKAQKLRQNPRIRLAFGSRAGPSLEGTGRWVSEAAVWQRASPLFFAKYQPYYKSVEAVHSRWEKGDSVLIEVTPTGG